MQLDPQAFNAFLANIGQTVSWRRAFACPCVNPASGSAKPTCPHCHGKGRLWTDAVDGIAGISGQKVQRQWATFGLYEAGDVVLTLPSDSPVYDAGQFDRISLSDSSVAFSINFTRGANTEVLRVPVISIERVFWITDSGLHEGDIPTILSTGVPRWPAGSDAPPEGAVYSMTGRQRPEYFVYMDLPSDRAHHGGAPLPRKVVLRKFDLFGR